MLACPRCADYAKKYDEATTNLLKTYYGAISADEYEILRKRIQKLRNPFRADGYVRVNHEAFFESYRLRVRAGGECYNCGLEVNVDAEAWPTNQDESKSRFEEEIRRLLDNLGLEETA